MNKIFLITVFFLGSCIGCVSNKTPQESTIEKRLGRMESPVIVVSKGGTTVMVRDGNGKVYIFTVNSNSSLHPKDTIK